MELKDNRTGEIFTLNEEQTKDLAGLMGAAIADLGIKQEPPDFPDFGEPAQEEEKNDADEVARLRAELEGYFEKLWGLGVYDDVMWVMDYLIGATCEKHVCRDRKTLAAMAAVAKREVSELVDRDCVACGAEDVSGGTHFFSFRMICRKCWHHLAKKWKSEGATWRPSRRQSEAIPF